jgi:hypothetical protein
MRGNRSSRDVLNNRLLLQQVKPHFAIELAQVTVLVEMFDRASYVVNLTHQVVVARPDKQLGPALELAFGLTNLWQNQTVDTA